MRVVFAVAAALALSGPAGAATFVFEGRGWGHGVGMSQWGARGYAEHGWDHRRILAHYYPGTILERTRATTVRVLLAEGRREVVVGSRRPYRIVDARGKARVVRAGRRRVTTGPFPLRFEPGGAVLTLDGAGYRGNLVVRGRRSALQVVNELPLERYLRGVVPWEMPHDWPAEALEAQAVAARSYALATLKHGSAFDLYADTRDQVYGGIRAEERETNLAVGATAGQVLTWSGRPALTYYFSTSGGRTAAARDTIPWAPRVPYLVSVADPYDGASPHHTWGPYAFAARKVAALLHVPAVLRLELRRARSGRVRSVRIRWRGGQLDLPGRTFQRELGLPSAWFALGRHPHVPVERAPARLHGWIVVVASVPASARRPRGRVLRSDEYPSLAPGYWVVYRGPFPSRAAAAAAARGGAYVKSLTRA